MSPSDLGGDYSDLGPAPPADPVPPAGAGSWEPSGSPPGLSTGQVVFGAILVVVGTVWLLSALDVANVAWRGLFAAALVVIGLALMVVARTGHHGGLIALGVVLSLFLATASTVEGVFDVPFEGGIGERTYQPDSAATLEDAYRLSIGQLVVDLTAVDFPQGTTELEVSVVIGQAVVELPPGVSVQVIGRAAAGNVRIDRRSFNGVGVSETVTDDGFDSAASTLVLRVAVGLGELEVRR